MKRKMLKELHHPGDWYLAPEKATSQLIPVLHALVPVLWISGIYILILFDVCQLNQARYPLLSLMITRSFWFWLNSSGVIKIFPFFWSTWMLTQNATVFFSLRTRQHIYQHPSEWMNGAREFFWLAKTLDGNTAALGFIHDSHLFTFCETSGKGG